MLLSFNQRIFLLISILITMSLLIFSTVSYYKIKFYLQNEVTAKQMNTMQLLKLDINSWMEPSVRIVTELAKELGSKSEFTKEEVVPILARTKMMSNAVQVYLGLEDGRMIYNTGKELKRDWYDPRARPWYMQGIVAEKTLVSEPFVGFASNHLTVCIVSPIVIDGIKQGVVAASYYVNKLYKKVKSIKIASGYAYVMDEKGKLIIHPDKSLINLNIHEQNAEYKKFYDYVIQKKEGMFEYRFEGAIDLMSFGMLSNGWYVVVSTKKDVAYAFVDTMLKLFLTMGTLMVAISIVILATVQKKYKKTN